MTEKQAIKHATEFIRAFLTPSPLFCKKADSKLLLSYCNTWAGTEDSAQERISHEAFTIAMVQMGFSCVPASGSWLYFNISEKDLQDIGLYMATKKG